MAWTMSYHIPTAERDAGILPHIFGASVFDDVWIFYDTEGYDKRIGGKVGLTIFNTETRKMIAREVNFPENFWHPIRKCVSHNNNVYFIGRKNYETGTHIVFELNTTTMEFTRILSVEGLINQAPLFLNNLMHVFVEGDPMVTDTDEWIITDLVTNQVIKRKAVVIPHLIHDIPRYLTDGKTLYIAGDADGSKMFVWKNNSYVKLAQIDNHYDQMFCGNNVYQCLENNTHWTTNNSIEIRKFDFETENWNLEVIPKSWQGREFFNVRSMTEINGKIHAVIYNGWRPEREFELRIFERELTLYNLCLLKIVNDSLINQEPAQIEKKEVIVAFKVRENLENMWSWMSYEHWDGIWWAKNEASHTKYREVFRVEIDKLVQEGVINADFYEIFSRQFQYAPAMCVN